MAKREYGSQSITIDDPSFLCDLGCGQPAKYYSVRTKKYRCANSTNSCPVKKKKLSKILTNPDPVVDQNHRCDWGCGQNALFRFKNGKYCCSWVNSLCPVVLFINKEKNNNQRYHAMPVLNGYTCSYSCNQEAKYIFKSGLFCCGPNPNQCDGKKETTRNSCQEKYGTNNPSQTKEVQDKINEGRVSSGSWRPKEERRQRNKHIRIYNRVVEKYTEISWANHQKELNPDELLRSPSVHLDHICSKQNGYRNNIPPWIIGHWTNLKLMSSEENVEKSYRNGKTLEQLIENFYEEVDNANN